MPKALIDRMESRYREAIEICANMFSPDFLFSISYHIGKTNQVGVFSLNSQSQILPPKFSLLGHFQKFTSTN